jgi:hypothetical protein
MVFRPSRLRLLAVLTLVSGLVMTTTPSFAGASWTAAKTWGTNGRVSVILSVGGNNIIGGDFTSVVDTTGNSYPAAHIAVISASTGVVNRSWLGSADDDVNALAVSGSWLYVGGSFSKLNNVSHRSIGALNLTTGALITGFTLTANKPVAAVAYAGGSVFIGGLFTSVSDSARTTARTYLAKAAATTGLVDQTWAPRPDLRVRALQAATDGTKVYAGGDFATINGSTQRSTALLPVTGSGAPLSSYKGGPTNNSNYAPVLNMALAGSSLYVAAAGGGGGCTALNATTGTRIWGKHANGNVQAVIYNHGYVYCAGHFGGSDAFDGQTRYKIAAVVAAAPYNTTSYAPRFDSALGIWAMSADSGHTYAGGDFTHVSNVSHPHFAAFTDTP